MTNDLTQGKITPLLVKFTIPLLFGNIFQLMYNSVDSIIVGQLVGKEALAAVGTSNPLMTLAILFVNGMCIGASILMGTQYGAKKMDVLKRQISTTMIAGIVFLSAAKGNSLYVLYGILTLTLCGGDAFHLVPRIIRAVRGSSDRIKKQLSIGLQVSSITMPVFYIILLYVWKATFPQLQAPVAVEVLIWLSAILRILICLLPQNNWCTDEGNPTLSILRNAVFALTGLGVIILYAISGNTGDYHMTRMVAAILISFGCYLPVTLFSKTKPKVGLLMIPKTCSYMWIIAMGLQLL